MSSDAVRGLLEGYLGGRVPADRLVPAVAAEYYRTADRRTRDLLGPIMEVIERAAPGVGQLARAEGGAGFAIRLAERPFPSSDQGALRQAVAAALAQVSELAPAAASSPGLLARLIRAVRRLFSASA
jgi:hypothetical protein